MSPNWFLNMSSPVLEVPIKQFFFSVLIGKHKLITSNGNRTEWCPIRSVIIQVINFSKIYDIYKALFLKSKQKKFQFFSLAVKKKAI